MVVYHPSDDSIVYVPDLGCDCVRVINISEDGILYLKKQVKIEHAGAGPRHMEIHPSGEFTYVLNELGNHLSVFQSNSDNLLQSEIQNVPTLPE